VKDFRRLQVWRKAHELVLEVYQATRSFPVEECYGLTAQVRRASASVPANLAEACGRRTDREFGRYLQIGMGSAVELEYHLLLARDLGYLNQACYEGLQSRTQEVQRMLGSLIRKVEQDPKGRRALQTSDSASGEQHADRLGPAKARVDTEYLASC
jgi:four helix bundle protein